MSCDPKSLLGCTGVPAGVRVEELRLGLVDFGELLLAAPSSLSQLSGCWIVHEHKAIPMELWMDKTEQVFPPGVQVTKPIRTFQLVGF